MLRSPAPAQYEERNIFEALVTRQRHGSLGRYSPHTTGAALGSLVWGFQRHRPPLVGHQGCVNTLRWNSCGTRLVSGSDDCMLNLWDARGVMLERLRTQHCFNIFDAQFKPSEEGLIASCAADGDLCLTPVHGGGVNGNPGGTVVWTARSTMALKLSFRPGDPEVLLCSYGDGSVRIFDLRAQRPLVSSIPVVPDRGRALIVAEFSPSGDLIATGADDTVRIIDFRRHVDGHRAPQPVRAVRMKPLQRGTCGVSGVSWSRGGRLVLANYMAGDIVLFDTTEAQRRLLQKPTRGSEGLAVPGVPEAPEMEEEGEMPTISTESSVRQRFHGRSNQQTFAKEVRFLFEDHYVVSGGDCGHLFIWRTSDGTLLQRLRADGSICNCVAPHPTLPLVAASGIDDTVKLFEVGGVDRPPLVRRAPPVGRGRRLLNVVSAASALRSGSAAARAAAPCRSWLSAARKYVQRRFATVRSVGRMLFHCRFRREQQMSTSSALTVA
mmetsp:Transcript_67321/g.122883  ORF Transcript_67321/g.122883 Transcript_67321/m.122883 type:complete len:494 (-) Transcript_67321:173-1654(-)